MIGKRDSNHDAALRDSIEAATQMLGSFSVQLYRDLHGKPDPCGTAFFVEANAKIFLVSAAHVLDEAVSQGLYFYSDPNIKRHLSGQLYRSSKGKPRADDTIDIGVLLLGEGPQPPFPSIRKAAMNVSYLKATERPRTGRQYVFVGFPATKTVVNNLNRTVEVTAYAYRNISIPEHLYETHGLYPDTHLIIPMDLKRGVDANGQHQHFPKPQGMSGAPVFELFREDGVTTAQTFPVVAVATTYRKRDTVVFATDVSFVLDAIALAEAKL